MGSGPIMAMPPPPPGFVMQGSGGSIPPPPPGFVIQDDKKRERILAIGSQMPDAPDRINQAFDVAADPVANQSITPPERKYGFTENLIASLPFGDEAGALGAATGRYLAGKTGLAPERSFGESYQQGRALERAAQEEYQQGHPAGDIGGKVLGVAMAGPAAGVRIPATVGGRIAQGMAGGAEVGGLYGAGQGDGLKERAANAAIGAAGGATAGAVVPAVAAGVRGAFGGRSIAGPTVDELRQQAHQFYDQMDQAGVQLSGPSFQRIAQNIAVRARNAGIDPSVHPKAYGALQRLLSDATGPRSQAVPTLRNIDTLRQVLRDAAGDRGERRIAGIMVDGLDEQLNRLRPSDIAAGNPAQGLSALKDARELWSRMRKGDLIEQIFERAKDKTGANYTSAGMETALRQEFRGLANQIRKGQQRGFSNAERAAIQRVVRGGPVENFLRLIGKFAPRGVISSSLSTGAGYAAGGPVGAVAVPMAGEIGRRAATAMTMRNAERASDLVRSGAPVRPQLTAAQQRLAQLQKLLIGESSAEGGRAGFGARLLNAGGW